MLAEFESKNSVDENNNPTGEYVKGTGLEIQLQRGEKRQEPNGTFVEIIIAAAKQRIEFYNESKFKCRENSMAITKLDEALMWLNKRTQDREKRQVEGTHLI